MFIRIKKTVLRKDRLRWSFQMARARIVFFLIFCASEKDKICLDISYSLMKDFQEPIRIGCGIRDLEEIRSYIGMVQNMFAIYPDVGDTKIQWVLSVRDTNAISGCHEFELSIPPKMERLWPFATTGFFPKTKNIFLTCAYGSYKTWRTCFFL